MSQSSQGQYKLAKFAFNIYGSLGTPQSNESISPSSSLNSRNSKQLPVHFGDKVDQNQFSLANVKLKLCRSSTVVYKSVITTMEMNFDIMQ